MVRVLKFRFVGLLENGIQYGFQCFAVMAACELFYCRATASYCGTAPATQCQ